MTIPRRANMVPVEVEDRIADMLHVGGVPYRIAAFVGVRPTVVRRVARDRGIPLPPTRAPNRIPAEVEARVVQMLRDGAFYRVIAEECGVSRSAVYRVAEDHGLKRLDPELPGKVEHLLRSGVRANRIRELLGVNDSYITHVRSRAGLPMRPIRPITTREIQRARELLEDGASYGEVDRTLGRAPNTFRRVLPGYTWTPEQIAEWKRICRLRPEDRATDVFKLALKGWAENDPRRRKNPEASGSDATTERKYA